MISVTLLTARDYMIAFSLSRRLRCVESAIIDRPRKNQQTAAAITLGDEEDWFHHLRLSKVEKMERNYASSRKAELRQIREWLDDLIENELEFTPEFEHSIREAERDMAAGKVRGCVRRLVSAATQIITGAFDTVFFKLPAALRVRIGRCN